MSDRPYLYYELTNSVCTTCYRKVEAKIVLQEDRVYMHKRCPHHGFEKVLISTDVEYYKRSRLTLKPGQLPVKFPSLAPLPPALIEPTSCRTDKLPLRAQQKNSWCEFSFQNSSHSLVSCLRFRFGRSSGQKSAEQRFG